MTEPTKSLRDQIADLIDENAEVRGEHYNDHAILTNADELAASIVELLSLSAPSALESGKAPLADATPNPASSDLSSLRKGAEVMREALSRQCDNMAFVLNHVPITDQWFAKFERELTEDRAALVSGSREEQSDGSR